MMIVIVTVTTMVTMTRMPTSMMVTRTMTTAMTRQKAKEELGKVCPSIICTIKVERVKAVKIAQIKEQQGKQCPVCYSTAIQHRFTFSGLLIPVLDIGPDLNPFHRS